MEIDKTDKNTEANSEKPISSEFIQNPTEKIES